MPLHATLKRIIESMRWLQLILSILADVNQRNTAWLINSQFVIKSLNISQQNDESFYFVSVVFQGTNDFALIIKLKMFNFKTKRCSPKWSKCYQTGNEFDHNPWNSQTHKKSSSDELPIKSLGNCAMCLPLLVLSLLKFNALVKCSSTTFATSPE